MSQNDETDREGSDQRAADRGRGEWSGLPTSDKPNLGDPAIVEDLLRSFLGRVVEIRTAYHRDEIEGPEAAQAVQDAAGVYERILMGHSDEYAASGWNAPDHLGAYLVSLGYDPDPQRACFAYLVTVANDLMAAMVEHEEGRIDDDTAKLAADGAVEDGVQILLGLPATA